jgi:hypothetical protein
MSLTININILHPPMNSEWNKRYMGSNHGGYFLHKQVDGFTDILKQ